MNTPVSFPLAELAIQKGFHKECKQYWNLIERSTEWTVENRINPDSVDFMIAPTIADVVMWLYEKHGIWMFTDRTNNWFWTIQKSTGENIHQEDLPITEKFICHGFNSPTEAYEAAIKHTLDNLI